MKILNKITNLLAGVCLSCLLLGACSDNTAPGTVLKNDCIKWTNGPWVAGLDMEFAYAMALPYGAGKIVSAQATASIPGAGGTWMEHHSYYTNPDGQIDTPVLVGDPSVTEGNLTQVNFVVDTCAATLRYYYKIPEEAKGKQVSFTFSATADNGETVSYKMGPYTVSQMDIKLDLTARNASRYISIEDMATYTEAQAAERPDKIDLLYVFQNYRAEGILFQHSFVAPAADPQYLPNITLPPGVNRNTKIRKGGPMDAQLGRLHLQNKTQPGLYVDDPDLLTMDFSNMPNYALNFQKLGDGFWAETQDGKYRAYIFVYITGDTGVSGATISMKRITMK